MNTKSNIRIDMVTKTRFDEVHLKHQSKFGKITQSGFLQFLLKLYREYEK